MLHPSVCLICVHCRNCSKNLFSMLKIQNMSREKFYESKLSFARPHNLSVPNRWECPRAPATRNISSLQTLSDFSEGLCHITMGVREQRAIWPIRRDGDSVGQIGRFTIGCRPGPCGCHPWTSKMSVPPGIKRQDTTTEHLMRNKHQRLQNIILLITSAFRSYIWCKLKDVQLTIVTVMLSN